MIRVPFVIYLLLLVAGAAATLPAMAGDEDASAKDAADADEPAAAHVARTADGVTTVTLTDAVQQRIGLQTRPLPATTHAPQITAYGTLIADPAATFNLRAPTAGTLRALAQRPWPALGEAILDGAAIAAFEPRLTPLERIDVATRLAGARGDVRAAQANLDAARASYAGKRELHDTDRIVSDRSLEEAAARVQAEEARLEAATETMRILVSALTPTQDPASNGLATLTVPSGGIVVEATVQPGEAVEAGQLLLQVVDPTRLIARVETPLAAEPARPLVPAMIVSLGDCATARPGEPLGMAGTAGLLTRGSVFLYRVAGFDPPLLPGTPVQAYIPQAGAPLAGVTVPPGAVLRYAGLTWVYVQVDETTFARRQITLHTPTPAGWFATAGIAPGEQVVVSAAQLLLSEELKAQIEAEETAGE